MAAIRLAPKFDPGLERKRSMSKQKTLERESKSVQFRGRIYHFPRLPDLPQSAEGLSNQLKADRLAALDERALYCYRRGRKANIEMGRVFLQEKELLGHGPFEKHFAGKFAPLGIAPRTARTYMAMALEADAQLAKIADSGKSADSADFPLAMDAEAVNRRKATAEAEAEVGRVAIPRAPKMYRLSLAVPVKTRREWNDMHEFWKSQRGARIKEEMLGVFQRSFKQFLNMSDKVAA